MTAALLFAWWTVVPAEAKRPKPSEASTPEAPPPQELAPSGPAAVDAPTPRFEKTVFPGCGCAAYLPTGAVVEPPTKSPDGSEVWTVEQIVGSFGFGAIAVKLAAPAATPEEAEELLISYLDYLRAQFEVTASAGVGRGHTMEDSPARGVIDFWESKDGEKWSVRAWSTPERLAVFVVHGPVDYPHPTVVDLFGKGFRIEAPAP